MRILYVSTISNTINAFLIPHIKMLVDQGHHVDVACNVQREIDKSILELDCKVYDISFSRTPLKKANIKAYYDLKKLITNKKYDLVHTHTPVASAVTRLACKNINETKVFYTAHGFHFYNGAPIKNWIIYYSLEKWLSSYTDTLVTINKEDYERAKNNFRAERVEYVPGVGLDMDKIKNVVVDKKVKRQEIGVPQDSFIILSVGELNKNKNHEVIIRAIAKLNNPNIEYVICGEGVLETYLRKLSNKLGVSDKVHLLGFRKDIPEICKISDVFTFPSLREGLGMAALEAMACGLPIITSNVHGIVDYSIEDKTGYNCRPKDVDGFSKSIKKIFESKSLRYILSKESKKIVQLFTLDKSLESITKLYNIDTY